MTHKIFCWSPVLTDHVSFTYSALSETIGSPITCLILKKVNKTRKNQGWKTTKLANLKIFKLPYFGFLITSLFYLLKNRKDVHIFGSPFESIRIFLIIIIATRLNIRVYLISESYSPIPLNYLNNSGSILENIKVWLRPYIYRAYVTLIGPKLRGIFAISNLSIEQFEKAGVSKEKIFPFGYFTPKKINFDAMRVTKNIGSLRLIFVGSLIPIKGLSTLIKATEIASQNSDKIKLDIYGPGEIKSFNIKKPNIKYKGIIPFGSSQEIFSKYDLMVLPSLYDGWGVVVNEALLSGIPVLCSNMVGARVLIEKFRVGEIFSSGDHVGLAEILTKYEKNKNLLYEYKSGLSKVGRIITPKNAALYISQTISADLKGITKPVSPWYFIERAGFGEPK